MIQNNFPHNIQFLLLESFLHVGGQAEGRSAEEVRVPDGEASADAAAAEARLLIQFNSVILNLMTV